nr:YDG domain-containing protein [Polynucleobacter sp. IMCC 30228]
MTVVGGTAVNTLSLPASSLGVSGVAKVYDGSSSISGLTLNTDPVLSHIIPGDLVSMKGTGNFTDQNVGVAKSVTINVALSGADANNYFLSSSQLTGNIGTITQLPSVTYIASTAGLWSNSVNWTNGATPTGNNVGEVIIPVGKTVIYDSALVGTTGSAIINNGAINFTGSNNFTFSNNVSGTGTINQSGAGTLTVSGNNAGFTGNLVLSNATALLGSLHAISGGAVVSDNGSLGTTTGTTIQSLLVNTPNGIAGSANLQLISDITSNGAQVYNANIILNPAAGSTITLSSNNAGITFNGKIDSPAALASSYSATPNSLTVTAATTIAINDSVGSLLGSDGVLHGLNSLAITAPRIELTADILTKYRQTYTGSVYVGDNGNEGFLLDKYITDVGLNPITVKNSLDGKNRVNARTLISEDPSVAFVGSINDLTTSGSAAGHNHSLYVAAISHDADASLLDPPTISAGSIGDISRPYSVEFRTLIFGDSTPTGTVTSGSIITIAASTLSSGAGLSSIPASGYPVAPGSGYPVVPGSDGSGSFSGSIGSLGGSNGSVGSSGIANNGSLAESSARSTDLGITQAGQIGSGQMSAGILQSLILANNNFEVTKMIFDISSEVSVSMVGGEANFNLNLYTRNSKQLKISPDKTDATMQLDKLEENRVGKKRGDDTEEDE